MTMQMRLVVALQARGAKLVTPSPTRKYIVLTREPWGFYYVGKNGALRVGRTVSGSIPVDKFRAQPLAETEKVEQLLGAAS
jgi:hypothetical protein